MDQAGLGMPKRIQTTTLIEMQQVFIEIVDEKATPSNNQKLVECM